MTSTPDPVDLLRSLTQLGSHADLETKEKFCQTFLPIPEHARAYDLDVVLVVGSRGAGKTALFNAVIKYGLYNVISRYSTQQRLDGPDYQKILWFQGYPRNRFPETRSLDAYFSQSKEPLRDAHDIWFSYLTKLLYDEFDDESKTTLKELIKCEEGAAQKNVDAFRRAREGPTLAIDRLDERLQSEGRFFIIGYDALDSIGGVIPSITKQAIQGLIAFWASYTRRWPRIRAKLFIRTDLYDRYARGGGADISKLASNRAEIIWSDKNLYAMMIKRIANSSPELFHYCEEYGVKFKTDDILSYIPIINDSSDAKSIIHTMLGKYMGTSHKKGLTDKWILTHIRDGHKQAFPRPLIRLVEDAANYQLHSNQDLKYPLLIGSISLRNALETVSTEYVRQSKEDEFPWLYGLEKRLKGETIPFNRSSLEKKLRDHWNEPWGENLEIESPMDSPRELIEHLIELGIFRLRTDERIDVPDLYLFGLGLKRRGGVKSGKKASSSKNRR